MADGTRRSVAASTAAAAALAALSSSGWLSSTDEKHASAGAVASRGSGLANASASGVWKNRLNSTEKAHREYRQFIAAFERIIRNSQIGTPTTIARPIETRWTSFGTLKAFGDNRQGECNYMMIPACSLFECDEMLKQTWNVPVDGYNVASGTRIHYLDSHLIMRNQSKGKTELDVWVCWPREDVPVSNSAAGTAWNDEIDDLYVPQSYAAPRIITTAFTGGYVQQNGVGHSTSYPFSTNQARLWNEWDSSPSEFVLLNDLFSLKHHGKYYLNPGDEAEFFFGLPHPIELRPYDDMPFDPTTDGKQPSLYRARWFLRKRNGPTVLIRARGRLSHDETKQGSAPNYDGVGTYGNFGLFNMEWAIIRKYCQSWIADPIATTDRYMNDVPENGAPPQVNQCAAIDSNQVFQKEVADEDVV